VLSLSFSIGCSEKETPMPTDQRWGNMHSLKGWTIQAVNTPDLIEHAHLKRHPKHWVYTPISESKPLSVAQAEEYASLNEKLHAELKRVSKEHFANTTPPPDVDPKHWLAEYYTPFTYQNEDWYGPSYECYLGVRTDYVSAELLRKLQALLTGDFQDWCIQISASNTPDFSDDYALAIFSDQVIVPSKAAKAFKVPETSKRD
jgi:hypothetical protein